MSGVLIEPPCPRPSGPITYPISREFVYYLEQVRSTVDGEGMSREQFQKSFGISKSLVCKWLAAIEKFDQGEITQAELDKTLRTSHDMLGTIGRHLKQRKVLTGAQPFLPPTTWDYILRRIEKDEAKQNTRSTRCYVKVGIEVSPSTALDDFLAQGVRELVRIFGQKWPPFSVDHGCVLFQLQVTLDELDQLLFAIEDGAFSELGLIDYGTVDEDVAAEGSSRAFAGSENPNDVAPGELQEPKPDPSVSTAALLPAAQLFDEFVRRHPEIVSASRAYGIDAQVATDSDGTKKANWLFAGMEARTYRVSASWLSGTDVPTAQLFDDFLRQHPEITSVIRAYASTLLMSPQDAENIEDAMQETFIDIMCNIELGRLRRRLNRRELTANEFNKLLGFMERKVRRYYRRMMRERSRLTNMEEEHSVAAELIESAGTEYEAEAFLETVFPAEMFSPTECLIINMHTKGHGFAEIAAMSCLSVSDVMSIYKKVSRELIAWRESEKI